MRVMSYNICCLEYGNKRGGDWKERKIHIADIIRLHKIDIAGLQEPAKSQIEDLKQLLPEFDFFSMRMNGEKGERSFDVIFYRKSCFEVLESSSFFLSDTPDVPSKAWGAKFTRGACWLKLRDKTTGKIFYFFTTQFDYHSKKARNESALLLRRKIDEIVHGNPLIVAGDFNIFPALGGDRTYKILTEENKLIDAQKLAVYPPIGPAGTWSGFKRKPKTGVKPDYIFVNNQVAVVKHEVVADTFSGRFPSDHLPVMAEVNIR